MVSQVRAEITEATRFLNESSDQTGRDLAMISCSLGVYYVLDLAAANPEHIRSVVIFYGTRGSDFSSSKAACPGHFAGNGEFKPQSFDDLEKPLKRAGRLVTFYHYSGAGHWFFESDRSPAYDQAAASPA